MVSSNGVVRLGTKKIIMLLVYCSYRSDWFAIEFKVLCGFFNAPKNTASSRHKKITCMSAMNIIFYAENCKRTLKRDCSTGKNKKK